MRRMTTREENEGYGVYEVIGQDIGLQDAMAYGVYEPVGDLTPDISSLFSPVYLVEERDGLVFVRGEGKEPAIAALGLLVFHPGSAVPPATNVIGVAEVSLSPQQSNWVRDYVAQGYVVMVDSTSSGAIQGPPMNVACSKDPAAVLATAGRGRTSAIIDGPADVIAQAQALAAQTTTQPSTPAPGTCPTGSYWVPILNQCMAVPAGIPTDIPGTTPPATTPGTATTPTAQQTAPATEPTKSPSWLVPAIVGLGAVLVVGVLIVSQKEPMASRR